MIQLTSPEITRMHFRRFSITLLLISYYAAASAQDETFGVWTTLEVQKKYQKWDFAAATELRTSGFYSSVDRVSLQLEASYEIAKAFKIGANYEGIDTYDTKYNDYQLRNRFGIFVQGKQKFGDFTFILREKIQLTTKDDSDRIKSNGEIDTYKIDPDLVWRNKLKVKYNIPKFPVTPSLSAETFFQLNNPDGYMFEKLRYTLSFDYKIAKRQHIELYGLVNSEIYGSNQGNTYVLGLTYSFTF